VTVTENPARPAPNSNSIDCSASVVDGRFFVRLQPPAAAAAHAHGALLVDIRSARLRRRHGEIPGALVVAGPVRDWRLEPGSPLRVCETGSELAVVVVGDSGPASILAASALRGHGVEATDIIGGFPAWAALGLPVCAGTTLAGRYADGDPLGLD
jgi:rhodanese-related sulfurtransferase